jgi:hypothetical protein
MAGPIYKVFLANLTEAAHQLSQEEQDAHMAKIADALEKAGGKPVIYCNSRWSSEQWTMFGVEEFPDIEAVQKHTQMLEELGHYRYIDSITVLGTETTSS